MKDDRAGQSHVRVTPNLKRPRLAPIRQLAEHEPDPAWPTRLADSGPAHPLRTEAGFHSSTIVWHLRLEKLCIAAVRGFDRRRKRRQV